MKKILIKAVLVLILIGLISCFANTKIPAAENSKEIRLRYDSKVTIFWDIFTLPRPEDSVEYYEWTDYEEGKSVQRIKIEGEFIRGYKTFINLSFNKETGQENSKVVIRKIVTEAGIRKVVISESDFQRSFGGIITAIEYLRECLKTHQLKVGEKHEIEVFTNKEKIVLSLEITDEKNIEIGDFNFPVYVIKITPTDKTGKAMSENIEIWFIKEGKLTGCIAKLKMSGMAFGACLRLTLNKAFISKN